MVFPAPSPNSSSGIARSRDWRSTGLSFCVTGSVSNRDDTRRQRLICASRPFEELRTRLTAEQGKRLVDATSADTLRSKRNRSMLSLLIGCGLRRAELLGLTMNSIQLREEHWVIADLVGKGGHIRTVPMPLWVKRTVDSWTESAHITTGRVFRAINKAGRIWGDGMTPKVLWEVVKDAAARAGIEKLAPHDLRRTCARLCHLAGGELDQIQFLLGHVSIQTTERYKQKLRIAVNDKIGLEPAQAS
jgi:integrase